MADIFYLAFKIPNLFRRIFAEGGMSAAFIPLFNQLESQKDHQNRSITEKDFFSLIFLFLALVLLCLIALIVFFAPELSEFLFYWSRRHQDPNANLLIAALKVEQTTLLIQIMMPYLGFISLSALYQSILQSKQLFGISTIPPILFNLTLITVATGILWIPEENFQPLEIIFPNPLYFKSILLASSVVLGGVFQLIYPWWQARKINFTLRLKALYYRDHPILKKFLISMIPVLISSGVYQIGVLLIDPIALSLQEGTISFLFYSNRLLELPLGIIGVSLTTISLPLLAQNQSSETQVEFQKILNRTINLLWLLIPPVLFISIVFRQEIVSLLFKFKKFDDLAVSQTSICFLFHILALPAIFLYRLFINVFYSKNNTRTPLYAGLTGLGFNVILALLITEMNPQPYSIALASSISSYLIMGFLLWRMKTDLNLNLLPYLWNRFITYLGWSLVPALGTLGLTALIGEVTSSWVFSPAHFWTIKLIQLGKITLGTAIFLILYWIFLNRGKEEEIGRFKKRWRPRSSID